MTTVEEGCVSSSIEVVRRGCSILTNDLGTPNSSLVHEGTLGFRPVHLTCPLTAQQSFYSPGQLYFVNQRMKVTVLEVDQYTCQCCTCSWNGAMRRRGRSPEWSRALVVSHLPSLEVARHLHFAPILTSIAQNGKSCVRNVECKECNRRRATKRLVRHGQRTHPAVGHRKRGELFF